MKASWRSRLPPSRRWPGWAGRPERCGPTGSRERGKAQIEVWRGIMVSDSGHPVRCAEEGVRAKAPDFPGARQVAFKPGGSWSVSSDDEGLIMKWSGETGERLADPCMTGAGARAAGLALRSDGRMLLSGGLGGQVCCWRLEADAAPPPLAGPVRPSCEPGGIQRAGRVDVRGGFTGRNREGLGCFDPRAPVPLQGAPSLQ